MKAQGLSIPPPLTPPRKGEGDTQACHTVPLPLAGRDGVGVSHEP